VRCSCRISETGFHSPWISILQRTVACRSPSSNPTLVRFLRKALTCIIAQLPQKPPPSNMDRSGDDDREKAK